MRCGLLLGEEFESFSSLTEELRVRRVVKQTFQTTFFFLVTPFLGNDR